MLPCDFALGIAGALPHAGSWSPSVRRRVRIAAAPTNATPRAKMAEKLNALFPLLASIMIAA